MWGRTRRTTGRSASRWTWVIGCCVLASICGKVAAHAALPTPTAALPRTDCPQATPEPLLVDPVVSPTDELHQYVGVRIGNGDRVEVVTESGRFVATGDFSGNRSASVEVALQPGGTHHLEVLGHVREMVRDGCVFGGYTLRTTTDFHGVPLAIVQGSDHGPTIEVAPQTLTLYAPTSFTITVRNAGPPGEALEISFLQFHHAYSQGDYAQFFSWDISHLSLPLRLAAGEALELPVTYRGGATASLGSRLVLQVVSNARNNYATQYLAYAGRPAPTPTPTPPSSSGCERALQSAPPRGPAGTVVELTGECQPIHSGGSAYVYLDDELIGRVSGETGGDYQNLVRIPPHVSPGVHDLRIEQSLLRSSTTFEVTQARPCVGDCNGDADIDVGELVTGVSIALARQALETCTQFDANSDAAVSVAELIAAVDGSLRGCVDPAPPAALAGAYANLVSGANDFSPGAVQASAAVLTVSPAGALLIEFPYWPGVVHVVASFVFDGPATLQGTVVLDDDTASPVSGEAFVVTTDGQRWITGTLTLNWFERSETVNFVMRRELLECQDDCDCYASRTFARPCPLDCANCDNFWTCQEGRCFEHCGVIPPDLCSVRCSSNESCTSDASCQKAVGQCDGLGACQPRPDACPAVIDPVCGCDGHTHANNCEREVAGVSLAHAGACTDASVGFVSVRVVNGPARQPVAEVDVTLTGTGQVSKTDREGIAAFEVPPGNYFVDAHVCCAGPGFIDYHVPITVETGKTVPVELQACLECICASPDTPIATPDGDIPMHALAVGGLVYSIHDGQIVAVPILQTNRVAVHAHHVVRLTLATGAVLEISPGHPTADGRTVGDLRAGDRLAGVEILAAALVPYAYDHTFDILPASDSGVYFAGGVPLGSTLRPGRPGDARGNP